MYYLTLAQGQVKQHVLSESYRVVQTSTEHIDV